MVVTQTSVWPTPLVALNDRPRFRAVFHEPDNLRMPHQSHLLRAHLDGYGVAHADSQVAGERNLNLQRWAHIGGKLPADAHYRPRLDRGGRAIRYLNHGTAPENRASRS